MIRYQSSSKWEDMEFPETKQMADEGGGHHAYVTNDLPDSMLLKCYQHCGSEWIYFEIVNIMCILVVNNITVGGGGEDAEIAHDKKRHKELFSGDIQFERFYRYLRYASLNTFIHLAEVFWDKMIELLVGADWFSESMTKKEGHWMLAHKGPGFSNTNCSPEVHWRMLKGAVLGTAGSFGAGYSNLRMQSNVIGYIENESIQTLEDMMQKKQTVAFPSSAKYSKCI